MVTSDIAFWLNSLNTFPLVIILVLGTFVLILSQALFVILLLKFGDYVLGGVKEQKSEVKE